ncbi:hypothetical protein V2W45_1211606, partial [Cenococcum geophilum]
IELISRLNYKNLVYISEVFKFKRAFYIISKHTAISLNYCISCNMPLSKCQLSDKEVVGKANIIALGGILISLIGKRYELSRNLSIKDPSYWFKEAIKFLSIITDTGPKELILYPFLKQAKALNL